MSGVRLRQRSSRSRKKAWDCWGRRSRSQARQRIPNVASPRAREATERVLGGEALAVVHEPALVALRRRHASGQTALELGARSRHAVTSASLRA